MLFFDDFSNDMCLYCFLSSSVGSSTVPVMMSVLIGHSETGFLRNAGPVCHSEPSTNSFGVDVVLLAISAPLSLDCTQPHMTSTLPGISLIMSYTSPIRFAKNSLNGLAPDCSACKIVLLSPNMYTLVILGVTSFKAVVMFLAPLAPSVWPSISDLGVLCPPALFSFALAARSDTWASPQSNMYLM